MELKMQIGLSLSGFRIELFLLVLLMMFYFMNLCMLLHIPLEIAQRIQIPIIAKMHEIFLGEKNFWLMPSCCITEVSIIITEHQAN